MVSGVRRTIDLDIFIELDSKYSSFVPFSIGYVKTINLVTLASRLKTVPIPRREVGDENIIEVKIFVSSSRDQLPPSFPVPF